MFFPISFPLAPSHYLHSCSCIVYEIKHMVDSCQKWTTSIDFDFGWLHLSEFHSGNFSDDGSDRRDVASVLVRSLWLSWYCPCFSAYFSFASFRELTHWFLVESPLVCNVYTPITCWNRLIWSKMNVFFKPHDIASDDVKSCIIKRSKAIGCR